MRTLILLLVLALPLPAETLEDFISRQMQQYGVPGASVGLIQDGQVTILRGFGVRRLGSPEPVGADTIFQLASVTKTFTGAAAGVAVDDGKLGWDQPAAQVLPELRLHEDFPTLHVTVSDFLSQRSGLPAFTGDLFDRLGYSREEVLRRLRHMPLSAGFREHAAYTNVGFFLAGMTVARAEGCTWEELVQRRLLAPLGMTRTRFHAEESLTEDVAFPTMGTMVLRRFDTQDVLGPAGEMFGSARDMTRFLRMLLNRGELDGARVLQPETVDKILTPLMADQPGFSEMPPIFPDSNFAYALGWGVYTYNGYQVAEKGGARAGVRTLVMLVPEKKLGLVVLCNLSTTAFPESVRARVLEDALGPSRRELQPLIWQAQLQVDKMIGQVPLVPPSPPKVSLPSPVPLERYVGDYDNELYGRLRISKPGDHLAWEVGNQKYGGPLYLRGLTTFMMVQPVGEIALPADATFVLDAKGQPTSVQTQYGEYVRVDKP